MGAIGRSPVEIVELLLQHGALVDSSCASLTPLMVAAQTGCLEVVKLLVKYGARN